MIDLSPEVLTLTMLGGILVFVMTGYPLGVGIGALTLLVGGVVLGFEVTAEIMYAQTYGLCTSYILVALPLFIIMGVLLENTGIVERLYSVLYVWMGALRGGLAAVTIVIGTVIAACVGVIAASVTLLALVALPSMVNRGYNKSLAAGTCAAGGTLGILIPPSIMLVLYGPLAKLSVGKLFMGAFFPGFLLSTLYVLYILIRCYLQRQDGPAIPVEERNIPLAKKIGMLLYSLVPPAILVLSVLGAIFFGIAPPTEAAGTGALAAGVLVICYRRFSWKVLKKTCYDTLKITSFAMFVGAMSVAFTGVFMRLGCGEVITNFIMTFPFGKWGAFSFIMFVLFLLGFFIDWVGIVFIMVPILTPLVPKMGFDPLWFAIMVCVNFQMSFLTPPIAFGIFFVKGAADPALGITTMDIIRGVWPFVIIVMITLGLLIVFPEIITWLPSKMITGF
jgi:tripartite ATP-independent transporter DctM subunit